MGWALSRLLLRTTALDPLFWTLVGSVAFVLLLPVVVRLRRRIDIAQDEVRYQGLLRQRRFRVDEIAAVTTIDVGVRAPDPQLVVLGRGGQTLLRVHSSFWPDNLEELFRRLPTGRRSDSTAARVSAWRPTVWTFAVMLPIQAAVFVGIAASLILSTLVTLPSAYDRLGASGVPVTAQVASCTGGRNSTCQLKYSYKGATATFVYSQHTNQFGDVGSAASLLVDRADPSLRYTAVDVTQRFNAGFGIGTIFGVLCLMVGMGSVVVWVKVILMLWSDRRQTSFPKPARTGSST